jgi:hypothetical protein
MPTDTDTSTDTDSGTDPGTSLLVIDNDALRRQEESELLAVREAIEGCEGKIARHETLDLPAFRQWVALQCYDLLNERRLIEEKLQSLRGRLSAIQGLARNGIQNLAAAFFWFHQIEQERVAIPPYVQRAWEEVVVGGPEKKRVHGEGVGQFGRGPDNQDEDGLADAGDEAVDGVPEISLEGSELRSSEKAEVPRYKSLYRKIALLLHPDLAGVLTNRELELWYQTQRAYEQKDVVALETILARCDRVGTDSLSLSELRAFARQANSRLATLRQSINGLAQLPSWRFLLLSSSEVKVRLRSVRRELEGVIRGLTREAALMENELARIEGQAERWMRRRKGEGKQLVLGF